MVPSLAARTSYLTDCVGASKGDHVKKNKNSLTNESELMKE